MTHSASWWVSGNGAGSGVIGMTCHSSGCTTKSAAKVRDALGAMVAPTVAPAGDGGSGLTSARVPSIFMLPCSLVARSSVAERGEYTSPG